MVSLTVGLKVAPKDCWKVEGLVAHSVDDLATWMVVSLDNSWAAKLEGRGVAVTVEWLAW